MNAAYQESEYRALLYTAAARDEAVMQERRAALRVGWWRRLVAMVRIE